MKSFFLVMLMTSLFTSMAFGQELGEKDEVICPALAETNTRTVKSVPTQQPSTKTKSTATAQ